MKTSLRGSTLNLSLLKTSNLIIGILVFSVSFSQNPIVTENTLPGSPFSEWGVPDFRDTRINGYATDMSLDAGTTVHFKINVSGGANYTIKIYRLGYYSGNGANLKADLGTFAGLIQPAPTTNTTTGLVDCSNWSESASWAIPSNAVSGLYVAKLERTGGGSNHIVFIVRNDASNSDLYLMIPDANWQAYNGYGGNNVYNGTTGYPQGHAVEVTYNRPFFIYNFGFALDGRGSDWYMNAEYPMIRFLERNGYDVTYTACGDVAANGAKLLNHKTFVAVSHDEYWSKEMRDNVEAARDAGVHLAFFTANEVYWKVRWEDNYRKMICYKEGTLGDGTNGEASCGYKCDVSSSIWTGLWRTGGDYDAGLPENSLTGQISWTESTGDAIEVPAFYKRHRFWRNTTNVSTMTAGQTTSLVPYSLGYEWDWEQDAYIASYPNCRQTLSSTTPASTGLTHKLSLYRAASGALVFGAGTIQWSWGLDGTHYGGTSSVSSDMQQATVNLFADMGVQPGTLQGGLVAATQSTDATAPSSAISSPSSGSTYGSGASISFSGSASDAGGGVVAGVEISLDGGVTWRQTTLNDLDVNVTWTYTYDNAVPGTYNVKSRAFDDSGNKETEGSGITITVNPPICPCTIFQPTDVPNNPLDNDNGGLPTPTGIEAGEKFRSTVDGYVIGFRFYKGAGTVGTHYGHLWATNGTLLAEAEYTSETASGWQQVMLSTPVAITANTTYVVSYFSSSGDYAAENPYFTSPVINGYLRGLQNGEDGPNGVSKYSDVPIYPSDGYQTINHFADVVFDITITPLPVKWLGFTAERRGGGAVLNWATAQEQNNKGFEVQRSTDGVSWVTLAFVNGAGNSEGRTDYSYTDASLAPAKYYYRLRQVDLDGRFEYSSVVSVVVTGEAALTLGQNHPNPFGTGTTIDITVPQTGRIRLVLYDASGRPVRTLLDEVKSAGSYVVPVQRASLSAGVYYYRLESGGESRIRKMTIY